MTKKIPILLFSLTVLLCGYAMAQTVTGKVTAAADGSALPGVSVVVKGTTVGTTTDANGSYTINTTDGNGTLVFSFIGFKSQEVAIGNQSTIDVILAEDIEQL